MVFNKINGNYLHFQVKPEKNRKYLKIGGKVPGKDKF
tara:strand:- start:662 stop:772 length:111 start_codon:yes stop_codon:yes gene_type:complete